MLPCIAVADDGKDDNGSPKFTATSTGEAKDQAGFGLEADYEFVRSICG